MLAYRASETWTFHPSGQQPFLIGSFEGAEKVKDSDIFISKVVGFQETFNSVFQLTDKDSFGDMVDIVQRMDIRMIDNSNSIRDALLTALDCFSVATLAHPDVEDILKLSFRTILMGLMIAGVEGMDGQRETVIHKAVLEQMTADHTSTATARKAAQASHRITNQQKATALADWNENGAQFRTMRAFALNRHKRYGVSERTLYDWIRSKAKESVNAD